MPGRRAFDEQIVGLRPLKDGRRSVVNMVADSCARFMQWPNAIWGCHQCVLVQYLSSKPKVSILPVRAMPYRLRATWRTLSMHLRSLLDGLYGRHAWYIPTDNAAHLVSRCERDGQEVSPAVNYGLRRLSCTGCTGRDVEGQAERPQTQRKVIQTRTHTTVLLLCSSDMKTNKYY